MERSKAFRAGENLRGRLGGTPGGARTKGPAPARPRELASGGALPKGTGAPRQSAVTMKWKIGGTLEKFRCRGGGRSRGPGSLQFIVAISGTSAGRSDFAYGGPSALAFKAPPKVPGRVTAHGHIWRAQDA